MPTYLYRIQPTRTEMLTDGGTKEENATIQAHFEYLQALHQAGVASFVGRTLTTDADTFGLVVFDAADETIAQSIMEKDPAVKTGVMQATLFPFRTVFGGHSA